LEEIAKKKFMEDIEGMGLSNASMSLFDEKFQ